MVLIFEIKTSYVDFRNYDDLKGPFDFSNQTRASSLSVVVHRGVSWQFVGWNIVELIHTCLFILA